VENRLLLGALWRSLTAQVGLTVFAPASGASVSWERDAAHLTLEDGRRLHVRLLVAADGADSWLRAQGGITAQVRPYGQVAVVANFACEHAHRGTAFQWFRGGGVLALLPLPGNRTSMVWSMAEREAADVMALAPAQLCTRVLEAAGAALGGFELITPPAAFPLRLVKVERLVGPRLALVGDAAHNVHPLAGQGVNLGFQDARELAQVLHQRGACGDTGEPRLLRRYERARREDVLAMSLVTHGLQQLFASERPALSWLRNRGLSLVDRAAPLKKLLVRHALG
jgi:ubiquinone biosynthesis UbiH/UbiF/VisC/COQ6 family hydroxylase